MSGASKDTTFDFYGLDIPKIKRVITNVPIEKLEQNTTEFLFTLEDNTHLHMVFETVVNKENIYRYMQYDAMALNMGYKYIRTAVIYSGEIESAPDSIEGGSINYKVTNVYMNRYDGDNIYEQYKTKIMSDEELGKEDILQIALLPFMKNTLNISEAALRALELAQKIKDQEQQSNCVGTIIGLTDKFWDKKYVKKLWEVLKMHSVVAELSKLAVEEERRAAAKRLEEERQAAAKKLEEALNAERFESRRQFAKNMLLEGADIEFVAKVTGMALDEVRGLKRETAN